MSDDLGRFEQMLLRRFEGCYQSPGGEVWVRYEDALEALRLVETEGFRLLGMEGFIVGPAGVFPAMSRIADLASDPCAGAETAERLLRGEWSEAPTDVHPDAAGEYMVDLCVANVDDQPNRTELVALVVRIMSGRYDGEPAQDEDVRRLQQAVPHPRVTDLLFWDKRNLTPEQVVDEALAYRPFAD